MAVKYRCIHCGKSGTVTSSFHLPLTKGCNKSPDRHHVFYTEEI